MLMVPSRFGFIETLASHNVTTTPGTTVTGGATAHTKGAWTQLIADTGPRSLGIAIYVDTTAGANSNTSTLLDIGIGPSGSEQVLIPNLAVGFCLDPAVGNASHVYQFPLYIPSNSRISARSQSVQTNKTAVVRLNLFQRPTGIGWSGTKVTAYGVNTATSNGTIVSASQNTYGTAVSLSSSTSNGIRYMQIGMQGGGRSTFADGRLLADVRIGATASIAGPLIGNVDTGSESVGFSTMNSQLQGMTFNYPPGIDLRVAAMWSGAAQNYDFIIYGLE